MKHNKSKKNITPISDGDSRPDKQGHKSKPSTSPVSGKKEKKFSSERGADVDRADDFRDAK